MLTSGGPPIAQALFSPGTSSHPALLVHVEFVVDKVALMHKHKRKILLLETEVSTPLISNKNFYIPSAVLEYLNVDGQTDTWKWFRFAPSHYQKLSGGARDDDIKDEGRCLWASLIKHHTMKKYRGVEA
jgi:hypothetical protein